MRNISKEENFVYDQLDLILEIAEATNLVDISTKRKYSKDELDYSYCYALSDDPSILIIVEFDSEGHEPWATPYYVGRFSVEMSSLSRLSEYIALEDLDVYRVEKIIKLLALKISVEDKLNKDPNFLKNLLKLNPLAFLL